MVLEDKNHLGSWQELRVPNLVFMERQQLNQLLVALSMDLQELEARCLELHLLLEEAHFKVGSVQ